MKFKKPSIGVVLTSLSVVAVTTFAISCNNTKEATEAKNNNNNNNNEEIEIKSVFHGKDYKKDTISETKIWNLPPKLNPNRFIYDDTNNYYEPLNGLKGKELISALTKLQETMAKKQTHKYKDLPNLYSKVFRDKYYNKDNSIVDIYSEVNGEDPNLYPNYTTGRSSATAEGQWTNREHIVPQAWFRKKLTPKADAHFVVPSDIFVNNKRNNYYHDYVESDIDFTASAGGKLGKNSLGETVFEPQDMVKGDVARAYLYYVFTYVGWINSRNSNSFLNNEAPFIPLHYLDVYKNWHKFDAVDEFNISVNNGIAEFSNGLRNPFVDYPDLFENLFGENPKPFVNKGVLASVKKSE